MFRDLTPFLKALLALTAAVLLFSTISAIYNAVDNRLVSFFRPPLITNAAGRRQTSYRAGQSVIVHFFVDRKSSRCFADYYQLLAGPVVKQFDPVRSTVITDRRVRRIVPYLYQLPADLPAGHYRWVEQVYPTCGGVQGTPYELPIGEIDIQ